MAKIQLYRWDRKSHRSRSNFEPIEGVSTIVADEQVEPLTKIRKNWLWRRPSKSRPNSQGYAVCNVDGETIYMARAIANLLGWPKDGTIDHIDPEQTLNNDWRTNLRHSPSRCLQTANQRLRKDSKSGEKNVHERNGWWEVRFQNNKGEYLHYVRFRIKEEAVKDAAEFRRKRYGEFARDK